MFMVLGLAGATFSCASSNEAGVEQAATGTDTPEAFQYTAAEVVQIVDSWPSGWPGAGDVSTAIIDVCKGANTGGSDIKIHSFQTTQLDMGRWKVTTACDYDSTTTGSGSISFEWIFFEDGPRLEPSGGRAADVTGQ